MDVHGPSPTARFRPRNCAWSPMRTTVMGFTASSEERLCLGSVRGTGDARRTSLGWTKLRSSPAKIGFKGWFMDDLWWIYRWFMADLWLIHGWFMIDVWLTYGCCPLIKALKGHGQSATQAAPTFATFEGRLQLGHIHHRQYIPELRLCCKLFHQGRGRASASPVALASTREATMV